MENNNKTFEKKVKKGKDLFWIAARVLGIGLGAVFLVASLSKVPDMDLFIRQVKSYGIISNFFLVTAFAWGLIAFECMLGLALLIYYRPRITCSITILLLIVFMGAIAWTWAHGGAEDCGCFGVWSKRTPAEAMLEDAFILMAAFLMLFFARKTESEPRRYKPWIVLAAALIGLILPLAFGFSPTKYMILRPEAGEVKLKPLHVEGLGKLDITTGAYFITIMDTDCAHCREAVFDLNVLSENTDLVTVIALSKNDENARTKFIEEFGAVYPIGQISEDDFWQLLGDGDIPFYILVRDGFIKNVWDQEIPNMEQIGKELGG